MASNAYAEWIDFTAELLTEPLSPFPHERIAAQLARSFEARGVSWEWRESPTRQGNEEFSSEAPVPTALIGAARDSGELLARHPLLRWFAATGNPRAQSVGRVPAAVAPARDVAWLNEALSPYGVEQQLAIPYWLNGLRYGVFTVARADDDFSNADLDLAHRLQPLLAGLARQARAMAAYAGGPTQGAPGTAQVELTGTELAVLALLTEGHTAGGIARRLGNSPRTVGKHLEHIYRKLGVSDRLLAARTARDLGLLPLAESEERSLTTRV